MIRYEDVLMWGYLICAAVSRDPMWAVAGGIFGLLGRFGRLAVAIEEMDGEGEEQ